MTPETDHTCSQPNCDRPIFAKGMCSLHYKRKARGAQMNAPARKAEDRGHMEVVAAPRVPPEVATALRDAADKAGISVYMLTSKILEEWFLEREAKRAAAKTPWRP